MYFQEVISSGSMTSSTRLGVPLPSQPSPLKHPTPNFTTSSSSLSVQPPTRRASSPQLHHRSSKGDLRDLVNINPTFPLRGIFDIGSGHFDVVLEKTQLTWTPVQGSSYSKGEHYPKVVLVRDIIAVQIQRIQRPGSEDGGHPRGVSIYMLHPQRGVANGLMWEEITLQSNNESCCQEWFQAILQLLNTFTERPKRLRVFIDTWTSNKAKQVFESKAKVLFHYARVETDVIEAGRKGQIQENLEHMDFDDVDGVVCVGGDSIVNEAVHGLLLRAQRDAGVTILTNTPMAKCRIPLGVIPVGLFNILAHSSQGISNPVTSVLHIILGHLQPVDVCSIHSEAGFLRFGFSAIYGFGSDCLRRVNKSQNFLKSRSVEYAMAKSLLKLRAYECEVSYQPVEANTENKDNSTCLKGCQICGRVPELSNLVRSTPIPLRRQDSPLVLRRHLGNTSHASSQGASPGTSPRTSPKNSPRPSPTSSPNLRRRNLGASVPSIPMIAWTPESMDNSSQESLVTNKKRNSQEKKSMFRKASHDMSVSQPNSRPSSGAWSDMFSTQKTLTTSMQKNLKNALLSAGGEGRGGGGGRGSAGGERGGGGGGGGGVPKVNITHAVDVNDSSQRGIGIPPKEDKKDSIASEDDWRTFQDSFLNIGILTLPSRSHLFPRGLSPGSHLGGGTADLVVVRKVNRKEFLKHMQYHGTDDDQFALPFVWRHEVKAVQIRPVLGPDDGGPSRDKLLTWNIDMELVKAEFIQMRVHRQLIAVFGEGVADDDFPTTSCRCL